MSVLLGLAMVLVYMVTYYRKPGLISACALTLNGIFLIALMASFGFALTLPGFAGFVLTLGMAVDANVLINERIRQELREGRVALKSVENGQKGILDHYRCQRYNTYRRLRTSRVQLFWPDQRFLCFLDHRSSYYVHSTLRNKVLSSSSFRYTI